MPSAHHDRFDPDSDERRPGPESTLDDVRERLVVAATAMLIKAGVNLSLDHVKLADVIAAAGVSRSTAYRSLSDEELAPQAVLHRETLTRILRRNAREANLSTVATVAAAELERQHDNLASGDPDRRLYAMRSIIRVAGEASYTEVVGSPERWILTASYGAIGSSGADDWRRDELARGEHDVAHLFTQMYTAMSTAVGYRLKRGLDVAHFATATAALVEGLAMRHGVSHCLEHIERPTGLGGELELWTLFAIAFEGMYLTFYEPIPPEDGLGRLTSE